MAKSRKMSWSPLSILGGILTGGLTTGIDAIVDAASGGSGLDGEGHWDWLSGHNGIPSGSPADALWGNNGLFSNPEGAWDQFMNGQTNSINQQIAEQNLQYQKERNEIEDARYEEETSYNRATAEEQRDYERAFAEEERDYQRQWAQENREYERALQQQLFEREDTAFQRQASQLSDMGINPLSQQLNGASTGAVVSQSSPISSSAPQSSMAGSSGRGGSALHNDFKMQGIGIGQALSAISGLADTVNGVATGQYQRDALALQNDAQFLKNLKDATALGIKYKGPNGFYRGSDSYAETPNGQKWFDTSYVKDFAYSDLISGANSKREYKSKKQNNVYDWESSQTKLAKSLGELDFQNLAENLLTNVANAGNWVNTNFKDFAKDMENNAIMNFVKKFFVF